MVRYTEEQLQAALTAVENGMPKSRAAKEFHILRKTIHDRINGATTRKQRYIDQQILSDEQESLLVQWTHVQAKTGCAPSHRLLRKVATKILQASGIDKPISQTWSTRFLRRHPELKTLQGKQIDTKRVKGVQPNKIKSFFEILNEPFVQSIRPQHRWNFDETGLMECMGMNGKVVGPSERPDGRKTRVLLVKTSLQRTRVTIIEAISAEGNHIPPVIIFKGESVQAQWLPTELEEFERWQFTASPNGWTSNDLGHEWLTTRFLPQTAPGNKDWRLLILDGHGSHVSDDVIASCAANRVYLVLLPPPFVPRHTAPRRCCLSPPEDILPTATRRVLP